VRAAQQLKEAAVSAIELPAQAARTLKSIEKTSESIQARVPGVDQLLQAGSSSVSSAGRTFTLFSSVLESATKANIIDGINRLLREWGLPIALCLTSALLGLAVALRMNFITKAAICALLLALGARVIWDFFHWVSDIIATPYEDMDSVDDLDIEKRRAQSSTESHSVGAFFPLVITGLCYLIPASVFDKKAIFELVRMVRPMAFAVESSNDALLSFIEMLPNAVSEFAKKTLGLRNDLGFNSVELATVNTVREFIKKRKDKKLDLDNETIVGNIIFYRGALINMRKTSLGRMYIDNLLNEFAPLYADAITASANFGTPKEPTGVYIFGNAGVGKSFAFGSLLARIFPSVDPRLVAFAFNPTSAFFDSDFGQPCMLADEFLATGDPREVSGVMLKVISQSTYIPPRASLDDKGKPFRPPLVIIGTNYHPTTDKGVDADAFNRRFLFFEQRPCRGFADKKGALDTAKVLALPEKDHVELSYLEFVPHIHEEGMRFTVMKPVTFGQMVALVKKSMAEKAATNDVWTKIVKLQRTDAKESEVPTLEASQTAEIARFTIENSKSEPQPRTDMGFFRKALQKPVRTNRNRPPLKSVESPPPSVPAKQVKKHMNEPEPDPDNMVRSCSQCGTTGVLQRITDLEGNVVFICDSCEAPEHPVDDCFPQDPATARLCSRCMLKDVKTELTTGMYCSACDAVVDSVLTLADITPKTLGAFAWKYGFFSMYGLLRSDPEGVLALVDHYVQRKHTAPEQIGFDMKMLLMSGYIKMEGNGFLIENGAQHKSFTKTCKFGDYSISPFESAIIDDAILFGISEHHVSIISVPLELVRQRATLNSLTGSYPTHDDFLYRNVSDLSDCRQDLQQFYDEARHNVWCDIATAAAGLAAITVVIRIIMSYTGKKATPIAPPVVPFIGVCSICKAGGCNKQCVEKHTWKQLSDIESVDRILFGQITEPRYTTGSSVHSAPSWHGSEVVPIPKEPRHMLASSIFRIVFQDQLFMDGLIVRSNFAISLRHGFYRQGGIIADGTRYTILRMGCSPIQGIFMARDFCEARYFMGGRGVTEEVCGLRLPSGVRGRDITKSFIPRSQFKTGSYKVLRYGDDGMETRDIKVNKVCLSSLVSYLPHDKGDASLISPSAILAYSENFKTGDCGSIIFHEASNTIHGFHAGAELQEDFRFATGIWAELVEFLDKQLGVIQVQGPSIKCTQIVPIPSKLPSYTLVGVGARNSAQSGSSRYIPSAFFDDPFIDSNGAGVSTVSEVVANLGSSEKEATVLLEKFLAEASEKPLPFGPAQMEFASGVVDGYLDEIKVTSFSPLTWERTVCGLEDDSLGPVVLNTSPGLDLINERPSGSSGKHYFAVKSQNGSLVDFSPKIKDEFIEAEKLLQKKTMPGFVYMLSLKDELQSKKKFAEGRTRGVYVCPLVLSLLYRKYFGELIGIFHRTFNESYSAVGMNVFSKDWDVLVKYMMSGGADSGFDGDFKGFQNYFTTQLMEMLIPILMSRFKGSPSERDAAITLLEGLVTHFVAIGTYIYQASGGNPSGNPCTTLFNTLLCLILLAVFYFDLAQVNDADRATVIAFRALVRCKIYGDDHIVAPHPLIARWFNGACVRDAAAAYGIKYTAAHKGVELSTTLTPICDLLFLGNITTVGLNFLPGIHFYALRETQGCVKVLKYASKKIDFLEDTTTRANAFLRLIATGGRDLFEAWRAVLLTNVVRVGAKPVLLCWQDVRTLWIRGLLVPPGEVNSDPWISGSAYISPPRIELHMEKEKGKTMEKEKEKSEKEPKASKALASTTMAADEAPKEKEKLGVAITAPCAKPFKMGTVNSLVKEWILVKDVGTANSVQKIPYNFILAPPSQSGISSGVVSYIANMYRAYSGSMRLMVQHFWGSRPCVRYSPYDIDPTPSAMNMTNPAIELTNLGPRGIGYSNAYHYQVQISLVTIYNMLRVPRILSDFEDAACNPGYFYVVCDTPCRIFMMPGDDFRFQGFQFGIPMSICSATEALFEHAGNSVDVELPEVINFLFSDERKIIPFTQVDLVKLYEDNALEPITDGFQVPTPALAATPAGLAILRSLGYSIPLDSEIVYLPVADSFTVDLTYGSTSGTWSITIEEGTPTSLFDFVANSSDIRIINGVECTTTSSVTMPVSNLLIPEFTQRIGFAGKIAVPILEQSALVMEVGPPSFAEDETGPWYPLQTRDRLYLGNEFKVSRVVKHADTGGAKVADIKEVKMRGDDLPMVACGERPWDFASLAGRPVLIGTYPWKRTSGVGSLAFSISLPDDLISAASLSNQALNAFQLVRCSIDVTVVLQSNPMQVGTMAIVRSALSERSDLDTELDINSVMFTPHTMIHAGVTSTTINFQIPYIHPHMKYPIVSYATTRTMATLSGLIINPLNTGPNGSTSDATIRIYGSFRNPLFSVLRGPSAVIPFSNVAYRKGRRRPVRVVLHGGIISKVDSRSYNITQAASGFVDLTQTGDAFDQKGELSHDKPNMDNSLFIPAVDRSPALIGPKGFTSCIDIDVLGFHPADPSNFRVGPADNSEVEILSIARMWGHLGGFTISSSSGVGSVLFSTTCTPNPEMFEKGYGDTFVATPLERISQIYHRWSGSLEYKFVFGSSTQSVGVSFETSYLTPDVPELKESQYILHSQPKPREEITVTVPFLTLFETLYVTPGVPEPNTFALNALGRLYVRLTSALLTDTTAPDTINVMVYVRAGPDFQLADVFQGIGDLRF